MTETIGRFEIRRELARGKQSIVYLGFDPHLQRDVVIKTLPHAVQSESSRLLTEARTVSRLRHPNIVPIFDAGDEGGIYLIFEYVVGATLANRIAQGPLSLNEVISVTNGVLDAIGHAHREGVIHRDLKPSNILITSEGIPRVTDFGIAMRVGGGDRKTAQLSGTPGYMAPEYIQSGIPATSNDLFAAGLILYEMLTGRTFGGRQDIWAVLRTRAIEPITLPKDAGVSERLANVVHRALALEPAARFDDADAFRVALNAAVSTVTEPIHTDGDEGTAVEFLFRRMRHKSDFPALSSAVASLNRIVASDSESSKQLSEVILRDFALTNKVLRVVNSALHGRLGSNPISTVSRAVIVLGFNAIRNMAVTLLLVENLQNKAHATSLRDEFARSMLTALIARRMAMQFGGCDAEEAFICGLFHNLGRLLTLFYFPEEAEEIRKQMDLDGALEAHAATRVLGATYEQLGKAVAEGWGFPESMIRSFGALPAGRLKHPTRPAERLHLAAGLADELGHLVEATGSAQRAKAMKAIMTRVQDIGIGEQTLGKLLEESVDEIYSYARNCNLDLSRTALGAQISQWRKGAPTVAKDFEIEADTIVNLSTEPAPHAELEPDQHVTDAMRTERMLTAGIQDISHALVEEFKLNDILRIILETIYRAMGFERVLLCIRDPKSNELRGRFGFGPDIGSFANTFRFDLSGAPDVFKLVLKQGVDLLITDANDPKIKERIPAWYRALSRAETFVLLPLTMRDRPLALIYADRTRAGEIVISEKELTLLRTLRNQALLAIKQSL